MSAEERAELIRIRAEIAQALAALDALIARLDEPREWHDTGSGPGAAWTVHEEGRDL